MSEEIIELTYRKPSRTHLKVGDRVKHITLGCVGEVQRMTHDPMGICQPSSLIKWDDGGEMWHNNLRLEKI